MVEQLAALQRCRTEEHFERAADVIPPDVHPTLADFVSATVGEQIGGVVPQLAVEVIPETVLKVLYGQFVF